MAGGDINVGHLMSLNLKKMPKICELYLMWNKFKKTLLIYFTGKNYCLHLSFPILCYNFFFRKETSPTDDRFDMLELGSWRLKPLILQPIVSWWTFPCLVDLRLNSKLWIPISSSTLIAVFNLKTTTGIPLKAKRTPSKFEKSGKPRLSL